MANLNENKLILISLNQFSPFKWVTDFYDYVKKSSSNKSCTVFHNRDNFIPQLVTTDDTFYYFANFHLNNPNKIKFKEMKTDIILFYVGDVTKINQLHKLSDTLFKKVKDSKIYIVSTYIVVKTLSTVSDILINFKNT